mgnify:CR=1 FL=1
MSLVKRNSHRQSSEAIERMEVFLAWLKTSPVSNKITSMQNDFIHVKFYAGKDDNYNSHPEVTIMEEENNDS